MQILITGASGYLGKNLITELEKKQHLVIPVKRELLYDTTGELKKILRKTDVVINLAGAPILQRWTKKNKNIIYKSRVETTTNLVEAIKMLPIEEQPKKFISASAVGIYKCGFNHDESSTNYDEGFLGKVVKDWEVASEDLPGNIDRVIFRLGLVLGKESKIIKYLLLPFKLGLGATLGRGTQPFPFIHINDVVKAFVTAVESNKFEGTYNLVTPENISNKEFIKTFSQVLHRPAFFLIPEFLFKLILGQASQLLTNSPTVIPEKLLKQNHQYLFPTIKNTISEILS